LRSYNAKIPTQTEKKFDLLPSKSSKDYHTQFLPPMRAVSAHQLKRLGFVQTSKPTPIKGSPNLVQKITSLYFKFTQIYNYDFELRVVKVLNHFRNTIINSKTGIIT
jgi:hypothetical protein